MPRRAHGPKPAANVPRRSFPLYLLLAAALFMRAFVPAGYMAERSDSGTIAVALCSGGVHLIPLKQDREAPDENERAEPPCSFAGLAAPALPPPLASELLAPTPVATAYAGDLASERVPLAHRLFPPARGPPFAA